MSVYVDSMHARFGRMVMCHMFADTSAELHAIAARLGLSRQWCQAEGTQREHYDVCLSKRAQAVVFGALEIDFQEVAALLRRRAASEPK